MPHKARQNTKKVLKPQLHQEGAITRINGCVEQTEGKRRPRLSTNGREENTEPSELEQKGASSNNVVDECPQYYDLSLQ